jgi:hypothetical protein
MDRVRNSGARAIAQLRKNHWLKLEATRNIELRLEVQENHCKIVAEARELSETVKNLAEKQKLEELRRRLEANRWKDFENTINTKIEARISDEIERELELSRELNDAVRREIDRRWMERIQTWEGVAQTGAASLAFIRHPTKTLYASVSTPQTCGARDIS